jgi:hypothetical protein
LRADSVVKDLIGRSGGLRAGGALRSRAHISSIDVNRGARGSHVGLGDAADAVEGEGRVASQARRAAGSGDAGADSASLVNVAGLVGKAALAVQGAALTSNELTSLLLRHMLVVSLLGGNIRQDTYARKKKHR